MEKMHSAVAILFFSLILVLSVAVWQSAKKADRLFAKAESLAATAKSADDSRTAVRIYEAALTIYEKLGKLTEVGRVQRSLGDIYFTWGQHDRAMQYYVSALSAARKSEDPVSEGSALTSLGTIYGFRGRFDEARDCHVKALEIARKVGDLSGESTTLHNLGALHADWSQHDKAIECYEMALSIARRLGSARCEGETLYYLGLIYWDRGHYDRALDYEEKALSIKRKLGDLKGEGSILGGLGMLYREWGQYDKAVDYHQKSLDIARKLGDAAGEGQALQNLGTVYKDWGRHDKAMEYYEKSLAIRRRLGDVQGESWTLGNLGEIHAHQGRDDSALECFRTSLAMQEKAGLPAAWTKELLGELYLDMGRVAEAEPLIKQAGNDPWNNASMGRLFLSKSDYQQARHHYGLLLSWAEKSGDADYLFTAWTGLGAAAEDLGDNAEAERRYRKAVELTEELRAGVEPGGRETFFDVRVHGFSRIAPYDGLVRALTKMNRAAEAFKESELTKARTFAEAVAGKRAAGRADIPDDVLARDSLLNDELSALSKQRKAAYEKGHRKALDALEPRIKALKADLAAHVEMLRTQYPLFAAVRYPQPMDLSQTALNDNEWVISYHVTDPGFVVYLTKGRHVIKALFKSVPRKELAELVRRFREPLEVNRPEELVAKLQSFDLPAGKKLADMLLGDLLYEVPEGMPVIIVPDDSLGVLPFEMLVLNDGGTLTGGQRFPCVSGAHFFGDRNPISYYQSVTALTLARNLNRHGTPGAKLLVLADPIFQTKDERVPKTARTEVAGAESSLYVELMAAMEREEGGLPVFKRLEATAGLAESLAAGYSGAVDLFEGVNATKDLFLNHVAPNLDGYDKIVFATHGYFGRDLPGIREPVLVLTLTPSGTDGFLRMSEIMGLRMNADIVALTACQTGLGRGLSGEGTMGMGRAFQYAGARSVLTSLWSVSEQASVRLVESFFHHVKDGKPKLEALKLARDEIRADGFDHPFFWAAFILTGEVSQ